MIMFAIYTETLNKSVDKLNGSVYTCSIIRTAPVETLSRRKEHNMTRIKSLNGYAIYQAGARDVDKCGAEEGAFYVYYSSDIRD